MAFKPFYFESNQRWGHFNTPEEVQDLLRCYPYEELRQAKAYMDTVRLGKPSFGFYSEYDQGPRFGEWIDKNSQGKYFDIKSERKLKLDKIDNRD